MKVIFAGFPKTGTKTLNAALTELGYNCYDYLENFEYLGNDWMKIIKEGATTEDFRRMFENVDAVMDIPSCFFWEEIHKAFPEAKIIFNKRESEDKWWKSFKNQASAAPSMFRLLSILSPTFRTHDRFLKEISKVTIGMDFKRPLLSDIPCNELMLRKFYRLHNSYFLNNAPMDQVLMIDFKKGWEPLCEFLGVPVPNTPFPHKNKNGSIAEENMKMTSMPPLVVRTIIEMMISSFLIACFLGYGVYILATRPSTSPSLFSYTKSTVDYILSKFGFTGGCSSNH